MKKTDYPKVPESEIEKKIKIYEDNMEKLVEQANKIINNESPNS